MIVNYIFNGIGLTILLLILNNTNKTVDDNTAKTKAFFGMIILSIIQIIAYSLTNFFDNNKYFNLYYLATTSNSLLYIVNGVFEVFFIVYLELKLEKDNIKKRMYLISIPSLITIILSLINIFIPIFFEIDTAFDLNRTRFDIVSRIVPFLYFSYAIFISLTPKRVEKKYITIPVIIFLIPIAIAIILEALLKDYSLLPVALSVSLASLYMNILRQSSTIDILSGLYNRVQLTFTLNNLINKKTKNDIITGIILDIDNFKHINDVYGHIAGDDTIKELGRIIIKSLKSDSYGYRYAGDEFVIIDKSSSASNVNEIMNTINKEIDAFNLLGKYEFKLSVSYGYTRLEPNDTFNSFISKMDHYMYLVKKEKNKK